MHNGMVKVITGMRRSGKSYLLNEIFYDYLLSIGTKEDHIIKFAFDSADDLIVNYSAIE
jgi:predicted AAA+ superfamily ATPase